MDNVANVLDRQAEENEDGSIAENSLLGRFLATFVNEYNRLKPDSFSNHDMNELMYRWAAITGPLILQKLLPLTYYWF